MAGDVLRDEHRLALDGYDLDVVHTELGATLAKVSLMSGSRVFERKIIELDPDCPMRDAAILAAMIGFMTTAGDPRRLVELAEQAAELPHIQPDSFTVLGVYGHTDWVSYCQHSDGRIFEVHHGLMAEEITQQQLDDAIEEDPSFRVRHANGQKEGHPSDTRNVVLLLDRPKGAVLVEEGGQEEAGQDGAEKAP